jgi:prepilin-type N-terminal cleavage/methylation domain-containing protein
MKKNNSSFTLVELMVVIAIIGILAGVVLVSMSSYGKKARASRALSQASSVIPSMISCAGNGGTPAFSGNICSLSASYGTWPTFPTGYSVAASNWTSSSNWYFRVDGESQYICCNSKMNGCGQVANAAACTNIAIW